MGGYCDAKNCDLPSTAVILNQAADWMCRGPSDEFLAAIVPIGGQYTPELSFRSKPHGDLRLARTCTWANTMKREEPNMLVRSLVIATVALSNPVLAAEPMAKSGNF